MTGRVCRIAAQSLATSMAVANDVCQSIEGDLLVEDEESRVYTDEQTETIRVMTDRYIAAVRDVGR